MSIYHKILNIKKADVPSDWKQIQTIDMHTGGEPLRVIVDGYPELKGGSILDYRRYLRDHHDDLRKALMWEPRGHADMYGCILTPPNDDDGDFGIVFMHNEGYSTMCGHAIIAISTLAVLMQWIDVKEGDNILKIDTPCGRITSFVKVTEGKIEKVWFHGVPSFVVAMDEEIIVPGLGKVIYDLAFGGAFYAYVDMEKNDFDFDLSPDSYQNLIAKGMKIKKTIMKSNQKIIHPMEGDLSFLYGTIFLETNLDSMTSTNVCIFAEGEADRCPTGSGVMGRMAIHRSRNEIEYDQYLEVSSIVGSKFKGSIVQEIDFGPYNAVIPCVEGSAFITGSHSFIIDPEDPLKDGFLLR